MAIAAAMAASCGRPSAEQTRPAPEIRLTLPAENPAGGFIEVVNLPDAVLERLEDANLSAEQWTKVFPVATNAELIGPLMLGTYAIVGRTVRFTPAFPFDPGRAYRVKFDPPAFGPPLWSTVSRRAAVKIPTTVIERVYPSSSVVPENQLRMYIEFSAPMGLRPGLQHVRLYDDRAREIVDPFLPLDAELWNAERTRYTVFFDPGRQKRGILPHARMGRSLTAGRRYVLVVDKEWRDANGLPLKEAFRREFRVGPPDERPLDPATWRITVPRAGTRDPLAVTFPEALDHGLLMRALGVSVPGGTRVPGVAATDTAESRWLFTPRAPWIAGEYQLVALSILEDLAGNQIGRAFEVDAFDRVDDSPQPDVFTRPFRIDSAS